MDNKYFKSLSIVILFSVLAACGGGNSKSSGEIKTASCIVGNNPLEEGKSCRIAANSTVYTCQSGLVGSSEKHKSTVLKISTDTNKLRYERSPDNKAVIYCASNPPS